MLTDAELAELERLEKAATKGPRINGERILPEDNCQALSCEEHADIYRVTEDGNCNVACATFDAWDAALVVAARNALPSLIAELRAARERIAELERKETSVRRLTELAPKAFAEILGVELGAVHGAVATGGKTEGEP